MSENKMDPMLQLVQAVTQKFLDVDQRLTEIVKSNLQSIIKAGLGLKEEHGQKIEFYQTNGFKSELHSLVATIAARDVQADAKACFDKMLKNKKFSANFAKAVQQNFEYSYREHFSKELGRLVSESADGAAAEFQTECMSLGKALDNTLAPIIAAARAKVLAEMVEKRKQGDRIGGYNANF
jgi:hypothetical protein